MSLGDSPQSRESHHACRDHIELSDKQKKISKNIFYLKIWLLSPESFTHMGPAMCESISSQPGKSARLGLQWFPVVSFMVLSNNNWPYIELHLLLDIPFCSTNNGPYIRDDLTSGMHYALYFLMRWDGPMETTRVGRRGQMNPTEVSPIIKDVWNNPKFGMFET